MQASAARCRPALLQSGAADEARGGHRRTADRPGGRRAALRIRCRTRPHADPRQGHARLHRQSCGTRLWHRGAAHRERRHRGLRRDRSHPEARGWISHGSVRTIRPDRARCFASGDGIDLSPVLRGAALPSVPRYRATACGRSARTKIRARFLRLWRGDRRHSDTAARRCGCGATSLGRTRRSAGARNRGRAHRQPRRGRRRGSGAGTPMRYAS